MRPDCTREAIETRRQQVATMTAAGRSTSDISAILGVTRRTITRIRSELGIAEPAKVPFTAEELATAAALFEDGCSRLEVARTLGRSAEGLAKHFPGQCWRRGEGASLALLERRVWEQLEAMSA